MSLSLIGAVVSAGSSEFFVNDSVIHDFTIAMDTEIQEESNNNAMADSVEFHGYIDKSKKNIKAIQKVLDLCRLNYDPPFMEKEQRPPQTSLT